MRSIIKKIQLAWQKFLIRRYRALAIQKLALDIKLIKVKKGKTKYWLLIAKDGEDQTIFNLGRHLRDEPVESLRRRMAS